MNTNTAHNLTIAKPQGTLLAPFVLSQELFNRWVSFIEASPRTLEAYRKAINYFLQWMLGNHISHPTRADVLKYRDYLKANYKPTTVKSYLAAVKLFFQWTAQEGFYPNIAEHIKGAKLDNDFKKDPLTVRQAAKLLQTIDTTNLTGLRDYAIISLMLTSGLRTVEVARANIGDLRTVADFTALYIQGKGRDEKTEYVKVVYQVETAVRAYLQARGETDLHAPLFASTSNNNHNGRLTTRTISGICKTHLIKSGLNSERVTGHSLRHSCGTINLLNGGTLEETKQLLRHKNLNTTMIYSHHIERAKNTSEERVAQAIFG